MNTCPECSRLRTLVYRGATLYTAYWKAVQHAKEQRRRLLAREDELEQAIDDKNQGNKCLVMRELTIDSFADERETPPLLAALGVR